MKIVKEKNFYCVLFIFFLKIGTFHLYKYHLHCVQYEFYINFCKGRCSLWYLEKSTFLSILLLLCIAV